MAQTTNFGWQTPDNTDLVKDGALAIRTLGNAVDTSMADLRGGTSGQILAKNSNTDMDFVWIANDQGDITAVNVTSPITGGGSSGAVTIGIESATTAQSGAVQLTDSISSTSTTTAATPNSVKTAYDLANGAIPKSLVDAAGDLIYATANDTPARLAIGTAGQVLRVNSGATAPEWASLTSGFTLITSASLSGSSVSVNNCFSSTYDNYLIITANMTGSTGGDDVMLRLRVSGTDSTSNYNRLFWGTSNYQTSTAQGELRVGLINSDAAYFRSFISNPFATAETSFDFASHRSDNSAWVGLGYHSTTTSYDGFTVYPTGGTFNSGTIFVYGYAK